MKKVVLVVLTLAGILFYSHQSHAVLIQQTINGDEVVYDNSADQYWVRNLSFFSGMTFGEKLTGISGLNNGGGFSGLTNWHLASLSEMQPLWSYSLNDIKEEFLPSNNDPDWSWYSGIYNETASPYGHYCGIIFDDYKSSLSSISLDDYAPNLYQGAWVAAKGNCAVPEPSVIFLLGSLATGLFGFAGLRKRR